MRSCSLTRTALFAALILAGAGTATAQVQDTGEWLERCRSGESWSDSRRQARHCEVRELTLPADRRSLAVNARPNGGISVRGWDRNEILVQALVSVNRPTMDDARAEAQEIRILTDDRQVRASGPSSRGDGGWSVSYRVYLPRQMDLELRSTNGALNVQDVHGSMELETSNGAIRLERVSGDVRGRTSNGGLAVRLDGRSWDGAGLDLRTSNGGVTIEVPDGYSAQLEAGTVNGRFTTDIPLTMQGEVRRQISAQLGEGGPPIRVRTTNGGVRIRRS